MILLPVLLYLVVALVATFIPEGGDGPVGHPAHTAYLVTNGLHLELILPREGLPEHLLDGLVLGEQDLYLGFGWGDKDFYLKTPTWDDFSLPVALTSLCIPTESLMHVRRWEHHGKGWAEIELSNQQYARIVHEIESRFVKRDGSKVLLNGEGYSALDNFYEAVGSYTAFNTCNSWVNRTLKRSGKKGCLWTPFDFGLMRIHGG